MRVSSESATTIGRGQRSDADGGSPLVYVEPIRLERRGPGVAGSLVDYRTRYLSA